MRSAPDGYLGAPCRALGKGRRQMYVGFLGLLDKHFWATVIPLAIAGLVGSYIANSRQLAICKHFLFPIAIFPIVFGLIYAQHRYNDAWLWVCYLVGMPLWALICIICFLWSLLSMLPSRDP